MPPGEVLKLLDRRALFSARWGYRTIGQRQRLELETKLAVMWDELAAPKHWSAAAVWGAFGARLVRAGLALEGAGPGTVIGLDITRLPDRFAPSFSGQGAAVLQAVTLGRAAARLSKAKKGAGDRLHWHGLAAEATEALADWCSRKAAGVMGWKGCRRISPGFQAWPEISEQGKIYRALRPGRIGLRLSRTWQMMPEYSTSALVYSI